MHTNTLGFQSPPETVSIGTSSAFQTKEGDRSTSSQAGPSIYDCLFPNYLANATDFRLFFFQRTFVHMTNFYVSYCNPSFCSEKKLWWKVISLWCSWRVVAFPHKTTGGDRLLPCHSFSTSIYTNLFPDASTDLVLLSL